MPDIFRSSTVDRNKKKKKALEYPKISVVTAEDIPSSQRNTLLPNVKIIDKYAAAAEYLEDNIQEIYPKELSLYKGPSEIFFRNLFKYNESEKENIKKNKDYYNSNKIEIIQGALIIAYSILKFDLQKEHYIEYNEKYISTKLSDEVLKLYLKIDEIHLIKRCFNCFGSIVLRQPYTIIDYIPQIILSLSENNLGGRVENLVNQLSYFFQSCNTIFQKAFDNNDDEIIKKINIITKDSNMIEGILKFNPFIIKLKDSKLNNIKNPQDKILINIQSLINNYYIFCSFLINNYLLLNNCIMHIYIEAIICFFIEKSSFDLIRKYLINIITKIFKEKVLKTIFNRLLIDENGNLKLKTLFYILRYISSERNTKNNFVFLIKFLKNKDNIKISDVSNVFEFLSKHLINKETKFYFIDFYQEKNISTNISPGFINGESEYVEIYDTLNPKSNLEIFKFIIRIIIKCMNESKEMDDIANIHKILTMLFINLIPLDQDNIFQLLNFLIVHLTNMTQMINTQDQGQKITQSYFKQYLEILNYSNFCINIKNNNLKEDKNIDEKYVHTLIDSYNKILLMLFKLILNDSNSKEYNILSIIPIISSYLLTLNNLYSLKFKENKKKEINTNIINTNNNENNILIEFLNILNKYLINDKPKCQSAFNPSSIFLYYIFYYLKNLSKKEYFDTIYKFIIKSLSIDDFKCENIINATNFILIKLCVNILFEEKDYITKEEDEVLSLYDNKYLFIQRLHKLVRKMIKEDNNNISSIINYESKVDKNISILKEMDKDSKKDLIKKYFIFTSESNFININFDNYQKTDENNEEKIEKYKETKDIDNSRYQKWLTALEILSNSKSKKAKASDFNNIEILLNSSFSFSEKKPIHFISIIKSVELDNTDLNIFTDFFSILGNIIIKENQLILKKENVFENIIYKFDQFLLHRVVFVLIKNKYEKPKSYFNGNFIFCIKPLNIKGVYLIKIEKNSEFKIKKNNIVKLLTQVDQDFNNIFSDFIILDTNNEKQINYFFKIIEMIFDYKFLEDQIIG